MKDQSGDLDGSGNRPEYVDLVAACLRTVGGDLRLEATLGGDVPARMPDGTTNMTIGFDLHGTPGGASYVFADADGNGWTVYLTQGKGRRQLSGRLATSGRSLHITVRVAELGGPQTVKWRTELQWTRSGLLSTSYAFDSAPNSGQATFRR